MTRNEPRYDKTNKMSVRPAKTQISLGIRPVLSESSLCAQRVAKDPGFLHTDSEDSDQTGRMPKLIWVFAGRTLILLVLSYRGSNRLWLHGVGIYRLIHLLEATYRFWIWTGAQKKTYKMKSLGLWPPRTCPVHGWPTYLSLLFAQASQYRRFRLAPTYSDCSAAQPMVLESW